MMRGPVAAAVSACALLSACGGEAGDLLALEVSGGFERAAVRLTVTEDGRARCNEGELRPISNDTLLDAREVERELEGLAADGATFGRRAPEHRRAYVARTRAGTVRWVEGAAGLPRALPGAALLAQELERELCG